MLQTSATNIQNQKVADVFSDGAVVKRAYHLITMQWNYYAENSTCKDEKISDQVHRFVC